MNELSAIDFVINGGNSTNALPSGRRSRRRLPVATFEELATRKPLRTGPAPGDPRRDANKVRMSDHELLVATLGPSRGAIRTAWFLLDEFGTFARIVSAPPARLIRVEGMTTTKVAALKRVQTAAAHMLRQQIDEAPRLLGDSLDEYLTVRLRPERVEVFLVLFLDAQQMIIADEEMARGTIDSAGIYTREIIRRCLELDAKAIVLAHNHPMSQADPTPWDIDLTREIIKAAWLFRILVRDHIIVSRNSLFSFMTNNLLR